VREAVRVLVVLETPGSSAVAAVRIPRPQIAPARLPIAPARRRSHRRDADRTGETPMAAAAVEARRRIALNRGGGGPMLADRCARERVLPFNDCELALGSKQPGATTCEGY